MKNVKNSVIGAVSGLLFLTIGTFKDNNFLRFTGLGLLGISSFTNIQDKTQPIQPQIEAEKTVNLSPLPITKVYIDGANFYGTTLDLNIKKVDFKKLAEIIANKDAVIKYYYAVSNPETPQETSFINYLKEVGFFVVKCTRKTLANGNHKIKGDDTKIAIDIVTEANPNDTIILVSGDGDFQYALEKAKLKSCQVTVVSSASSLSKDLEKVADNIIKVEDIKHQIQCQFSTKKNQSKPKISIKPILKVGEKPKTLPQLKRPNYLTKSA